MLLLPVDFLWFWFVRLPIGLTEYFVSLNSSLLRFFSFSLLIRTFFQPIKNEYRQGLVGFSMAMGIVVRCMLLVLSTMLLVVLLITEIGVLVVIVTLPLTSILLLLHTL